METKICSKCKEEKLLIEFHKDKYTKDGYYNWCKICVRKYKSKTKDKEPIEEGMKVCSYCKIKKSSKEFHKNKNNKDGFSIYCKKCFKEIQKEWEEKVNYKEKYKDRIKKNNKLWYNNNYLKIKIRDCIERAIKINVPYDTKEDLYNYLNPIYKKGICECCSKKLVIGSKNMPENNSPSLDRLIPEKGYVIGNISLLCNRCNTLKSNATPDELFIIADWYKTKLNNKINLNDLGDLDEKIS